MYWKNLAKVSGGVWKFAIFPHCSMMLKNKDAATINKSDTSRQELKIMLQTATEVKNLLFSAKN